jgi:outer membrane protein assembly factor BamA
MKKLGKIFLFVFFIFLSRNLLAQENTEIDEISFSGNNSFASGQLLNLIKTKESPNWLFKFLNKTIGIGEDPVYFDSLATQVDLMILKNFYFDNGFFKSSFSVKIERQTESNSVKINYIIKEKNPFLYRKLELKGTDNLPETFKQNISSIAKIDTNKRYSRQEVESINNEIILYLRNRGMMLVSADPINIKVDTLNNKVDVTLSYKTGEQYHISEVRVERSGEGKELVSDDLIIDIANIKTGDLYNFTNLQRTQQRLYRTNLFTSTLVYGVTADTNKNTVPINITSDIGLLHEFSPEVIINNEDNRFNLGLSFGFTKKNFLGGARKLSLNLSTASQNIIDFFSNPAINDTTVIGYADFRASVEQPYFFGLPILTKFENYVTIQKRKDEFNTTIFGSRLSFNFELPEKVFLSSLSTYVYWELLNVNLREKYLKDFYIAVVERLNSNFQLTPEGIDSLASLLAKNAKKTDKSQNSVIGVELGANKTDDILFPTRGFSLYLKLEEANSFQYLIYRIFNSEFNEPLYYKVLLNSSAFLPFFYDKKKAFGMKFSVGYIHAYRGNESGIPLNQRFNAGGSNSVRGWKSRELSPPFLLGFSSLDVVSPSDLEAISRNNATPGGFFLFEGSVENRFRLFGEIGAAIFLDYGNAFLSKDYFRFDKLAVASGLGFRYYSQIVPVRLDFGLKVYNPDDRRAFFTRLNDVGGFFKNFEFHLGIGEAF